MRLLVTLSLLLCSVSMAHAASQAANTSNLEQAYKLLDSYVAQQMKIQHIPGVSLAITDRHGLTHVATYGFADVQTRQPVTPETMFQIGSISKSFTAISLLQLRDEGKFDPQQPITKYLPWFSIHSNYRPITGHDVMTHTAGLPRDRDDVPSSMYQAAGVRDRWTVYAPGEHFAYSNVGFQIMGWLLQEITQEPLADTLRKRILHPLRMTHTEPIFTDDTYHKLAVGYAPLYDDRPHRWGNPLIEAAWQEYASGDGAIVSTPSDLAAYLRMLLNHGAGPQGRVLSEDGWKLLTQRAAKVPDEDAYYGYGIFSHDVDGHHFIGHSGGMIGYTTSMEGDLDQGIGVTVFENAPFGPEAISSFALKVMRAALTGSNLPALPDDSSSKVKDAAAFQGAYTASDGRKLVLNAQGDQLVLDYKGQKITLETQGKDSFAVNHPDFALFPLRFGRQNGKVVEAFYGGDWYASDRYSGPRNFTVATDWEGYVGHYRASHPWFNNFRIVLRKDKLLLIAPGGEEMTLTPMQGGGFTAADEGLPARERIFFDTPVHGKTLRAVLSGLSYYRFFTP